MNGNVQPDPRDVVGRKEELLLQIDSVTKTYGAGPSATVAVGDISLGVRAGEFVSIVGPSGCGKTTLLRCLSGLMPPSRGSIRLRGVAVTGPQDGMAVVFQDYGRSLFPWMSVRENVRLPLRHKKLPKEAERARVLDALRSVGLADVQDRYPWQLSGGMQQRAAIARAIAFEPEILFMDEPFASVDAQTRADLEDLILRVHDESGITILLVTHDIDEAVYLSDRVVVLTHSPSTISDIVDVGLPRPRDQIATKSVPEFNRLRARIYLGLKEAVRGGSAGSTDAPRYVDRHEGI